MTTTETEVCVHAHQVDVRVECRAETMAETYGANAGILRGVRLQAGLDPAQKKLSLSSIAAAPPMCNESAGRGQ